jgi:beta-lactamase superfamily II metal-dependent hydrolase
VPSAEPTLAILDVGHGNSAVLVDKGGVVVIDAGPGSTLLDYLNQEGITEIDVLLISHADKDHIEGTIALLASEEIIIHRVRLNSDAAKKSALWDGLLYALHKSHQAAEIDFDVSLTTRNTGDFNQGTINIEILAPNLYIAGKGPGGTDRHGRKLSPNSVSAVIRLAKNGQPIALFPGDIDAIGLESLLEDYGDCRAEILVFPHHGGRAGSGDLEAFATRLCKATMPHAVIFSIGRGRYNTPLPEIVAAVQRASPRARIACTQLSVHCADSLPSTEPEHLTDKFAQGREKIKCCAGTFVLNLSNIQNAILPEVSAHQRFIVTSAPSALCMKGKPSGI